MSIVWEWRWNGWMATTKEESEMIEITTLGEMMDEMCRIDALPEPERKQEAMAFMTAYRAENQYADANIGYLTGYTDTQRMARLQELFEVSHPIFGSAIPTPQEAFEKGMAS